MDKPRVRKAVFRTLILVAIIYAAVSLLVKHETWRLFLIGGWVLLPPLWFYVEYTFLFDKTKENFKEFKYVQELARNIWAGFALLLAFFYFK